MKKLLNIVAGIVLFCGIVYGAGEITLQGYLKAEKGTRQVIRSPGTININWTGTKYSGPVIYTAVSNWTSMAAVSFVTNGIVWIRNVGTSSAVTFSFDAGATDHLQVKTNEFYSFRLAPAYTLTNLHYRLTTLTTNNNDFEFTILEN